MAQYRTDRKGTKKSAPAFHAHRDKVGGGGHAVPGNSAPPPVARVLRRNPCRGRPSKTPANRPPRRGVLFSLYFRIGCVRLNGLLPEGWPSRALPEFAPAGLLSSRLKFNVLKI